MKKYFKVLEISSDDLIHEEGKYPINEINPFGPPFESKKDAKSWLKIHAASEPAYSILPFYSMEAPENMQVSESAKSKARHS